MEIKKVDLSTINDGAAHELFNECLQKVLANINDINVKADAPREIKMVFRFTPDQSRHSAKVKIECSTRLPSVGAHESSMFLSHRKNAIEAFVTNPEQLGFNFEEKKDQTPPPQQ